MKRILFILVFFMGLGSVNLYAQRKQDKLEKQEEKALLVRELVESKRYVINCDRIYPQRYSSRYITDSYSVEMRGDTLRSYLPYIGVAQSPSYGGENVLNFEGVYSNYQCVEGKKGRLIVSFTVENNNETLDYELTIYTNGKANVYIQPLRRDLVSYSGELELDE